MSRILIVDDDRDFLEGIKTILENAGYGFIATADSKTVQQKIRTYRPQLIILDVFLNDDNGKNIAQEVRKAKDTYRIPILLISGSSSIQKISEETKVDAYLHKPFSGTQLMTTIAHLI
jgi:DNA-binding response OmpR family regulator